MQTEFSDGRIGIRRYRPEDVPLLFAAAHESVGDLSQWMPWCNATYTVNDSMAFVATRDAEWERGEHYSFVVYDLANSAFLGGVGLNFANRIHNFANLGYWTRSSRTRQGIASAATRLIAQFAFQELKFTRLEIVVATGNVPSLRAAEKASARREGVLRNRLMLHGKLHDAVLHSLVPEDLRA
jgi:ribosomal-protein-serine acetyltransferase